MPKYNPTEQPTPEQLFAARSAAGLSQSQAAKLVHYSGATSWAACEQGKERIGLARWHLFLLLTKLVKVP